MITQPTDVSQARQAIDEAMDNNNWYTLRQLWYGRHRTVMDEHFAKWYPDAYKDGSLQYVFSRALRCFSEEIKPSLHGDRVTVNGNPRTVELFTGRTDDPEGGVGWLALIDQVWQLSGTAGAMWLHYAVREGMPYLELLWGDMFSVTPGNNPMRLQACTEISLSTVAGDFVYRRGPGGQIQAVIRDGLLGKVRNALTTMALERFQNLGYSSSVYPVFAFHRDPPDRAKPLCDEILLNTQLTHNEQLTDIEHHRRYMPGQPVMVTKDGDNPEGAKLGYGPNKTLHLEVGEDFRYAVPGINLEAQLSYVEAWLQMQGRLHGLSPETFRVRSRAETGPAKAADHEMNLTVRKADRAACVAAMRSLVAFLSPLLAQAGYDPAGLEIIPAEWESPKQADPLARAQAIEMNAKLGYESVSERIAADRGIPKADAEAIRKANLEEERDVNPARDNVVENPEEAPSDAGQGPVGQRSPVSRPPAIDAQSADNQQG